MTEMERKMAEALGLTADDFRPYDVSEAERMDQIEAGLLELAALIAGGEV